MRKGERAAMTHCKPIPAAGKKITLNAHPTACESGMSFSFMKDGTLFFSNISSE